VRRHQGLRVALLAGGNGGEQSAVVVLGTGGRAGGFVEREDQRRARDELADESGERAVAGDGCDQAMELAGEPKLGLAIAGGGRGLLLLDIAPEGATAAVRFGSCSSSRSCTNS
jgi:hypothetical protein